jgi:PAS domain S-box-containing protein
MVDQSHYFSFFEEAPDIILIFDEDWHISDINASGRHVLGYSRKEALTLKLTDLVASSSHKLLPSLSDLNQGESLIIKHHLQTKKGDEISLEASYRLNSKNFIISTFRDVTKENEMLSALKESKNRLIENDGQMRLIIDHAPAAVAMFDKNMDYIVCSQKWVSDWSILPDMASKEAFVGKNHYEIFPDIPEKWRTIHRESLKGAILSSDKEYFKNQYDEDIWLKWQSLPWYNSDGEIGGIMLFTEIITNQVKTQGALRESENLNRRLVENTPVAIVIQDVDQKIVFANPKAAEMVGATDIEELIGKSIFDYTLPENTDFIKSQINEMILTGKPSPFFEQPFLHKDGTKLYGESAIFPFEYNNKPAVLSVITDVSEIRKVSNQLQENEKKLREIIDLVPFNIFAKDGNGNILLANKAFAESYGVTTEYISNTNSVAFQLEKNALLTSKFIKTDQEVIKTQKAVTTPVEKFIDSRGNIKYLQTTKVPYTAIDNTNIKILGISADISERIAFEEKIKKSEESLDFYFSTSMDGFYVMEIDKPFLWNDSIDKSKVIKKVFSKIKVVKINNSMLEQYGGTIHNMIGYSLADFFKHDLKQGYQVVSNLLDHGRNQSVTEERKMDGTSFSVEGDYVCLYTDEGAVRGLFAFQKDITDRVKSDQELRKITDDLMKSNNELQQFAYLTSHDLRAPVINLSSLLKFYNKDNPQDADNPIIVEKIEHTVIQLQSTLNDLVNIVATKSEDDEEKSKISFSQTYKDVLSVINQEVKKADAQISTDFKVRNMLYSSTIINSIVLNLLTNAIKYRRPNKRLEIDIKTYRQDDTVCLEVKDNGMGIDLDKFGDKLFGIYQRFHEAPNSKGLGLYIIKTQVEKMGGQIKVKSKVNHGSTFSVFLKNNK